MTRNEFLLVLGQDGLRGIIDIDRDRDGIPHVMQQLESGQRVSVPLANCRDVLIHCADGTDALAPGGALIERGDGVYYLPFNLAELAVQSDMGIYHDDGATILPVMAETLDVQKRVMETGKVRVSKHVLEYDEIVDQALLEESVDVERVPVNRVVDGPVPLRYEGDTMILSVLEETLVVEKKLVLKEEVRITRCRSAVHKPQQIRLREEQVSIERMPGVNSGKSDGYQDV